MLLFLNFVKVVRVVTGLKLKFDFNYVSFVWTATVKSFSGTEAEFQTGRNFAVYEAIFRSKYRFCYKLPTFQFIKVKR